jgi:hypothetical protein
MKNFIVRFIIAAQRFSFYSFLTLTLIYVIFVFFTNNGKCYYEMLGSLWEPCTAFEEIVRFEWLLIVVIFALILGIVIALIVEIVRSLRKIKKSTN